MGTSATRAKRRYAEKHYKQLNMKLHPSVAEKFAFLREMGGFQSNPETLEAALNALSRGLSTLSEEDNENNDGSNGNVKRRDVTISFVNESLEAAVKDSNEWKERYYELEKEFKNFRESQDSIWDTVMTAFISSFVTILLFWLASRIL